MSALDVDAILLRAIKASRVERWHVVYSEWEDSASIREVEDGDVHKLGFVEIATTDQCEDGQSDVAEFIAHSREDVSLLVSRVRELESALEEILSSADPHSGIESAARRALYPEGS